MQGWHHGLFLAENKGQNAVTVVVPAVMWNYLRSISNQIKDAGMNPGLLSALNSLPERSENGLAGTVTLVPYANVGVGP